MIILHLLSQSASNSKMSTKGMAWFQCYRMTNKWVSRLKEKGGTEATNLLSHDFKVINLTHKTETLKDQKSYLNDTFICVWYTLKVQQSESVTKHVTPVHVSHVCPVWMAFGGWIISASTLLQKNTTLLVCTCMSWLFWQTGKKCICWGIGAVY